MNTFLPNVLCGTSHNFIVRLSPGQARTFRARMRVQRPGSRWRISYSNTADSTWDNGSISRANAPGSEFTIVSAAFSDGTRVQPLTFDGLPGHKVLPGEIITSDACDMHSRDGCIEFRWCLRAGENGAIIPATPDSQALCSYADGEHTLDDAQAFTDACALEPENLCALPDLFEAEHAPLPLMLFMGDSITQGCGTRRGMYESWAARIAAELAPRYAALNIGLGFARIRDAASDGAWLRRAKRDCVLNMCLGVNDIMQGEGDSALCIDRLRAAISALKTAPHAPRIVLFTIPPFDYAGADIANWRAINAAILAPEHLGADYAFDMASVLSRGGERDYLAKYGPHPDGTGGAAVAEAYIRWAEESGVMG